MGVDPFLESAGEGTQGDKLLCVLVGLPARGKTYIARRLSRYLSFFHGAPTQVYNVGEYRRDMHGTQDHTFFDSSNPETQETLFDITKAAMKDLRQFLTTESPGQLKRVAIFDAPNVTRARRKWIIDELKDLQIRMIFIECICNDEKVVNENILRTKLTSPDYKEESGEKMEADFRKRIQHYERVYEMIDDEEDLPYIKIFDSGRKIEIHKVHGYLQSKIVQFLVNVRYTGQSTFYLSRHGQSEYNKLGKIGGDSSLSDMGRAYAVELSKFVDENILRAQDGQLRRARLWTSSMKRTIETGAYISHQQVDGDWYNMRPRVWRLLDELYAGSCDGMTYEEIKVKFPDEYQARKTNKLEYRYPRGESYLDVIARLDPLIHEMERIKEPLLIIGHQVRHLL
eukprot:c5418_g1_i2.p1 GENE.c5418_g1_i2~~c5418_g1_i2.p1  ORF type:complete len:426 (-),score=63.66 c5418_g1_i2:304-1497(-)